MGLKYEPVSEPLPNSTVNLCLLSAVCFDSRSGLLDGEESTYMKALSVEGRIEELWRDGPAQLHC